MKEEIKRIMRLVQEGKLSPEDAAELIDAFQTGEGESDDEPPAPPPPPPPPGEPKASGGKDPFKSFIDYVENIGRDVSQSVNWQDVARQVREGAEKGFESLKEGIEKVKKEGKFSFDLFGSHEIREIELPLDLGTGISLKVENPVGDVRITGGAEAGSVKATAKVRGMDPEEAKRRAAEYTLILEETDHQILIRQPDVSGLQVDLEIRVPAGTPVDARTWSGELRVADTRAGCRANASNGNIRLQGLEGAIEVVSQSGTVSVGNSQATSLSIENKSGDVEISAVRGSMNVRTASGDLRLKESAGKSVSVESVSGDVHADFVEPIVGAVSIRTVNGASSVSVPDGSDCRVSLSTLRGQVVCALPLEDEARTDMHVTGRLGEGNGTLDVSAVNGSIVLKLRDSAS